MGERCGSYEKGDGGGRGGMEGDWKRIHLLYDRRCEID